MPPTNTVGRPQSIIWEYIDKRDTDDDDDDILFEYFCKGNGCKKTSKQKVNSTFQATRWAEHVVLNCNGFGTLEKVRLATSSNAAKVKSWLGDYNREQAKEQAMEQDNQNENQAMPLTDVGPWQGVNQKTSVTNKRRCVLSKRKRNCPSCSSGVETSLSFYMLLIILVLYILYFYILINFVEVHLIRNFA